MAQYATLKAAIDAVIKANGQKEITGTVLNEVLTSMVNSLGANYQLAGVATPSTNPGTPDQNVFYLAFEAGTYTNFNATVLSAGISILMWNGSWSSQTFYTIDATPTASSNNLVSSGAVFDAIKTDGSAYDVSAHFPTGGPNSDGKFTLEYILSNANTLIPAAWRKGGMSIRFVSSSDNKYVQYRFMLSDSFTSAQFTNPDNWQGVDDELTLYSKNIIKSGAVAKVTDELNFGMGEKPNLIEMVESLCINCGGSVGDTVELTPIESSSFCYALIDCQENDVFYIQGAGGVLPRLYCFIDSNNKIISNAASNAEINSPIKIVAPANTAKLILNDKKSKRASYKGELQNYIININILKHRDLFSSVYAARMNVPDNLKISGLVITYKLTDGWHIEQFIGTDISNWDVESNWDSKDTYIINANEYLHHPNAFNSVAAMRNAFPSQYRKNGVIVSYLAINGWHIEQFVSSDVTNWSNSLYWICLSPIDKNLCEPVAFLTYQSDNSAYINQSGIWNANTNARYSLIPVSALADYISIKGVTNSLVIWLKSDYTTSGTSADISDIDGNIYKFADGEIKNIKKPSDANYLYITLITGGGNNIAPKSVSSEGWYLDNIQKLSKQVFPYVPEPIDLSSYNETGHIISSDNIWVEATNAIYSLIPTNILGSTVCIKANTTANVIYAWLTQGYSGTSIVDFIPSDRTRHSIEKGTEQFISKPSDANYLYVLMRSNGMVDTTPEYLGEDVNNDFCKQLFELSKKVNDITPIPVEDGSMNLNIVSYEKQNTAMSYWYLPSVISTKANYKKLYSTFVDSDGFAGVLSVDLFSHTIIKIKLKKKLTNGYPDTHNCCFVGVLPNKKIIVGYSEGHNDGWMMNIRISSKAEDISEFDDVIRVNMGMAVTYGQYFYKNNKHYIFARVGLSKWKYIESTDLINWSEAKPFINATDNQYYILMRDVVGESDFVRIAMYSNPSSSDTNIRLGYIDFSTGKILNADATTELGELGVNEIEHTSFTILVAKPNSGKQRLFDLAISNIDDIKILFARVSTDSDGEYYIYDNGTTTKLCDAGMVLLLGSSYVNLGLAFISNEKMIICYGQSGEDKVSIWSKNNGSWSQDSVIYSELRQPENNVYIRNGYPIVDINGKYAIWLRGYYNLNSFYDYQMESLIYDIDKEIIF